MVLLEWIDSDEIFLGGMEGFHMRLRGEGAVFIALS